MVTLSAYDCVEVDGYLYFFSLDYNILFRLEISTGDITPIASIPEENLFAGQRISKIINYNGYLYLAPINSSKIWRYCLADGSWKGYELKQIDGFAVHNAICYAVQYNEKIFFFGCRYPAVVVLDLKTEELKFYESMYTDYIKELAKQSMDAFFIRDGVQLDNYVYMASCLTNLILKFDMDTLEYEFIPVGDARNRYSGIGHDGSVFYLSPRRKGDVVKWDGKDKSEPIKMQYLNSDDNVANVGVYCGGGKVNFFGTYEERFLNSSDELCILKEKYRIYEKVNEDIFVSLCIDGRLNIKKKNEEYEYNLKMDKDRLLDFVSKEMKDRGGLADDVKRVNGNEILMENELVSLRLLAKVL